MSLRVAVTGLAATFPLGGVFWDYLQYPLGLHRLGHDVLYVEDSGRWCYDPAARTFVPDGARNAARLARRIGALVPELRDRWFVRDVCGRTYGRSWDQVVRFCAEADLFLHLSASCEMREEYFAARTVAFVDSDPMYTQASFPAYLDGTADPAARARVEDILRHDVHFTFGENAGAPDCLIPAAPVDWRPTRQPVVLDRIARAAVPVDARRRVLTTVGSWAAEDAPQVGGVRYGGKAAELERFLDLPARVDVPLELALSGEFPPSHFTARGWRLADPDAVALDPGRYLAYLGGSLAEWSVAKQAYVASRSGWFSCRTACYLALGVPAVVQDTGFGRVIPTGEGVLAFSTLDEAAAAIEAVAADPRRHAAAARAIAAEHFDSGRVLGALVEQAHLPFSQVLPPS